MSAPHRHRPNYFAASPLDRLDGRRKDAAWIEQALASKAARFVPCWRGRSLVATGQTTEQAAFFPNDLARVHLQTCPWALLGDCSGTILFALDLSALDEPLGGLAGSRFDDLRQVASLLPEADAAILAHARGLMHWRTRHRFCSACGAACLPRDAGHVLACTGCGAHHFPRTDPAVIMLVTRGERALLGHPARFRTTRVFSTLAGFVEPGESLEEAVVREVWEEAGIRVTNVAYRSSQPWPFPSSIMLGFEAEALTEAITADTQELVEARWFNRAEIRAQDGFILPPDMSIARRLIDRWLDAG